MCGEAVWTGGPACASCGVRLPFLGVLRGTASSGLPVRDGVPSSVAPAEEVEEVSEVSGRASIEVPMTGRDALLGRLSAALVSALQGGRGTAVVLHGPAGSGKSALAGALLDVAAAAAGATVVRVRLVRGAREPLAPMERLVVRWAETGGSEKHDAGSLRRRLDRRIAEAAAGRPEDERRDWGNRLAVLAGLPLPAGAEGERAALLQRPKPFLDAWAELLRLDAARAPLLVAIDGVDRASDEGRYLLSGLIRRLPDAAVAWLATARSADVEALFAGAVPVESAEVEPLGEEALAELLGHELGVPPSRDLLAFVTRISLGYPGRAVETVRALERSGAVRREYGISHLEPQAVGRALGPRSGETLAGVFWDGLSEVERGVMQAAAVLGEVVWDEALVALDRTRRGDPPPDRDPEARHLEELETLRGRLSSLVHQGFLLRLDESAFEGTREYVFALDDLRGFVAGTVPREAAVRLHLAAARWLDVRSAGAPGFAEAIAGHLAEGGDAVRAAAKFGEAAAEAQRRALFDRSIALYRRQLDLLEGDDHPGRLRVLHEVGSLQTAQGRYAEAEESFDAMLSAAWSLGAPGKIAVALSKRGRLRRTRGEYPAARADLDSALRLFRLCGDTPGVAATLGDLGALDYLLGDYDQARRCHREAVGLRREMQDDRGTAVALLQLAALDRVAGLLDRAATKAEEALRLSQPGAPPGEIAGAMNLLAVLSFDRGDSTTAIGYLQEGLRLATGADSRMETFLRNNLGEVLLSEGRTEEAAEQLRGALAMAGEQDDLRALAEIQRNLARLSLALGRPAQAVEYAERARDLAERIGNTESRALVQVVLGEVWAAAAPPGEDPAAAYFAEATRILRELGHRVELARALLAHGAALVRRGRRAEARPLMAEAIALFTEMRSALAERARKLI
jgi:tetratricopeptide (TPR) repeat protein